jgi:hypothetical protein
MAEDNGHHEQADGGPVAKDHRTRRGLLAAAAGAVGALAIETVASAQPAEAGPGQPVVQSGDNTGNNRRTAVYTTGNNEWASLADPHTSGVGSVGVYAHGQDCGVYADTGSATNGTGVNGNGTGNGAGVSGTGGSSSGTGVIGTGGGDGDGVHGHGGGNGAGVVGVGSGQGPGVIGSGGESAGTGVFGEGGIGGIGVNGAAGDAAGTGVLAENSVGGNALQVSGKAAFSRSGLLTVAAGSSKATRTGVALTSASLVLVTLQQHATGVYVLAAVPNVSGSSFTVYLSKAVTAATKVAWFIVN